MNPIKAGFWSFRNEDLGHNSGHDWSDLAVVAVGKESQSAEFLAEVKGKMEWVVGKNLQQLRMFSTLLFRTCYLCEDFQWYLNLWFIL